MAQQTRPDLHAEIEVQFPDNTDSLITPADVRGFLHALVDSAQLPASDTVTVDAYTKAEADALLAAIKLTAEPVSYAQLTQRIAQAALQPGNYYQLTDFQLTHTIPNTTQVFTSTVEPLLLLAISPRLLRADGYSLAYPGDIVYYRVENNQAAMPGCTKGFIYRRHDTIQNNDLEIDFRNVVFRRWLELLPSPDYLGATSAYLACTDNGASWQDSRMFVNYAQTRNNQWLGFDQNYNAAIFGSLNYVADSESRTVNTRLTNSSILNVTLTGGSWFFNSYLLSSTLREVRAPRMQFYNFFQSTMVNATVADRFVGFADIGSTLIASTITTQTIANKCVVGGKDVATLGTGNGSPYTLSAATPTALGGLIVGAGLQVDGTGKVSLKIDTNTLGQRADGTLYVLTSSGNITAAATPTGVTAVRDHPRTGTMVRWDAMPGATFYQVYRSENGGPWGLIAGIPYNYHFDNQAPGQGDQFVLYYVVAANSAGQSPNSTITQAA